MLRRDLAGKRFGRLTVCEDAGRTAHQKKLWRCECDCGGTKITTTGDLMNGTTQSCGCLQRERASSYHLKHGYNVWICTPEFIENHFTGGYFSGGDTPDTFHSLDGRVFRLNVPLCTGCDAPVTERGCEACGDYVPEAVHGDPFPNELRAA